MIYTKGITKTVCAVLDEDIAQSIQQEARRERRSLSHQINHILRGYVAQQDMGKPDLRKLCAGKKVCGDCIYFRHHYRKDHHGWYHLTTCGHCTNLRLKTRKFHQKPCDSWEAIEAEK